MTPYQQQQPFYPQQMQQPQMMQPQMHMPPQAMQMQPQFQQPMPKPTWVAQPKGMAPRPMAPRPLPTNAELAQHPNPAPKVRLQDQEPTKQSSGKFVMPEPEALGLAVSSAPAAAPTATLDWNAIRARMHKLGVIGSHFDRAPQGGYRVIFTLPTAEPGRSQHIEAIGENEQVAVQQALSRAEEFVGIR